jgi:hypothetical protein
MIHYKRYSYEELHSLVEEYECKIDELKEFKDLFTETLADDMKTYFLLANWDDITLEDLEFIVKKNKKRFAIY